MAANKVFTMGPIALTTTTTTNLLNPPTATGGVNGGSSAQYIVMKHIRVVNKTGSTATVSLWIGATGGNVAGTEFAWQATAVPANSFVEWFGLRRLDSADFLVGGAGTATALSINVEGEIGVSG